MSPEIGDNFLKQAKETNIPFFFYIHFWEKKKKTNSKSLVNSAVSSPKFRQIVNSGAKMQISASLTWRHTMLVLFLPNGHP